MNWRKIFLLTWIGVLYGGGLTLLTDLHLLFFLKLPFRTAFFLPRYWISSLLAGYHAHFFLQMPYLRWRLSEEKEIGPESLVYLGCVYSTLLVYPSELILALLTSSRETMLYRMHAAIPFMIVLLCLYELTFVQRGVRVLYFLERE